MHTTGIVEVTVPRSILSTANGNASLERSLICNFVDDELKSHGFNPRHVDVGAEPTWVTEQGMAYKTVFHE